MLARYVAGTAGRTSSRALARDGTGPEAVAAPSRPVASKRKSHTNVSVRAPKSTHDRSRCLHDTQISTVPPFAALGLRGLMKPQWAQWSGEVRGRRAAPAAARSGGAAARASSMACRKRQRGHEDIFNQNI